MLAVLFLLRKSLRKAQLFFPFMPLSDSTQAMDFTGIKNTTFHKMVSAYRLSLSPLLMKGRSTNPCLPANTAWATLGSLKSNLQEGDRAWKSNRTADRGLVFRDKHRLDSCPSLGLEAEPLSPRCSWWRNRCAINVVVKIRENPPMHGSWAGSGALLAWRLAP